MNARWGIVAFTLLAVALAWPMQGGGGVPNAHYVLVKSLARGTPVVDRALGEVGDFSTNDLTRHEGRTYVNKAPGFAFAVLPAYVVLDGLGMRTSGDPARILWALGLWGVVLPALLLVLLVRERAERLQPGFGAAAAITLGLATLLLPYGTIFLSHALSALLVFAAFAVLWREREGPPRLLLLAAAGLLAGYATTTEYPNALAVAALGLYALARGGRVRRSLAYGVGALAGLLPLAVYNLWAFGSVTHVSYSGVSGRPATDQFDFPQLSVAAELLFSTNGFAVLTPVLSLGILGTVLLYRRGRRGEALLIGGLALAYLVFNAAYYAPFGGYSPGPRHLLPLVPLLMVTLGPVLRTFPVSTGVLAAISAVVMTSLTATYALAGYDGRWLHRLADRELTPTAASLVSITGWYAILPLFLAATAAAACAVAATSAPRVSRAETALGGLAALVWAAIAAAAPPVEAAENLREYRVLPFVAALGVLAAGAYRARGNAPRSIARHVR